MVAMRRQRGGRRAARLGGTGGRPDSESLYSFRTLVLFTIIFLSIIMLLLIVPKFAALINKFSTANILSAKTIREDQELLTSFRGRIFHDTTDLPLRLIRQLDAILVLGGGRPTSLTEPPLHVQRRCDDAAAIVLKHQHQQQKQEEPQGEQSNEQEAATSTTETSATVTTLPILCLSAGTAHLPQLLSADGLPVWESTACAAYLAKRYGTDSGSNKMIHNLEVHVETTSYDTIGNAFYARTNHIDLHHDPTPWRNLLIVTNEFHMDRSKAIFDWIFSLPTAKSSSSSTNSGGKSQKKKRKKKKSRNNNDDNENDYNLFYLASPNVGLSDEAVAARLEKEMASLKSVQTLSRQYKDSLSSVHGFLTQHHDLYTASKLIQSASKQVKSTTVSDMVRQSYGGGDGGDGAAL